MASKTVNPLDHLRPSTIPLATMYGVDLENQTYVPHKDFPNPKFVVRDDVLASLATATSPNEIPPIEIFLHTDGSIVCLDGAHRIINAIRKCAGNETAPFSRIKVTRFIPDGSLNAVLEAQIRSQTHNLEFLRGDLTEGEEVGVVQHLLGLGLDEAMVLDKIGRGNSRWISKIQKVINATPAVLEAVKQGELSLETGSKIATHVPVAEQATVTGEAIQLEQSKGGVQARVGIGVRKDRIKVASTRDMFKRLWSIFEQVEADYGTSALDPGTEGEWNLLMFYFGFEKTCDHDETVAKLRPMYQEYLEKENNPRPRGRPKSPTAE